MNRKFALVCLLALAGSAVLLAGRSAILGTIPSRNPSRVVPQRPVRASTARSVPALQPVPANRAMRPIESASVQSQPAAPSPARVSIPVTFEPNVGQVDSQVEFLGRGRGMTVFLTQDEITLRVSQPKRAVPVSSTGTHVTPGSASDETVALRLGGNSKFHWAGTDSMPARSNYFIGNDPKKWRAGVPNFSRAEAANVSPGIGVAVYGNDEGIEYDLRIAPGADVSKLRLTLEGAHSVRLNHVGDVLIGIGSGELRMKKPVIYEVSSDKWHSSRAGHHAPKGARRAKKYSPRRTSHTHKATPRGGSHAHKPVASPCTPKLPSGTTATAEASPPCRERSGAQLKAPARAPRRKIDGGYIIEADGSIGFRVGPHDPNSTLVVDPSLSVAYASFLGGLGTDTAASVAVDSSGKVYVGGTTASTSFPGALAQKIGPADGPAQFFVAKIDPTQAGASSLVYLTFLGGGGIQSGGLIAVDASGDVAITGTTTSTDFPVAPATDTNPPTSALANGFGNDVAVSEIAPDGSSLIFSTLFGGTGTQSQAAAGGIALDSSGDVYVASDVETTALDASSPDLPVTAGAFQTTWGGQPADAFLAIFQPPATVGAAATLIYCSYLGTNSTGSPGVGGIAVDAFKNAYIAGYSSNSVNGFPVKNAIQTAYGGGDSDAFLMKISPMGAGAADLVYSTLLGGSGNDAALAVALDSSDPPNAYITGTTQSPNFPTKGATGAYQTSLNPSAAANAFLSVVSQNPTSGQSALAYSTYFGGSKTDVAEGIAVATPSSVYVTGATNSPDFPWHDNLQAFNGAGDAFLAKFNPTLSGASSFIYATPLGGTSPAGGAASAAGNAMATFQSGSVMNVFIVGASTSEDFPTAVTTGSALSGFQPGCSSCQLTPPLSDAFVAEIVESAAQLPSVYFNVARVPFLPGAVGTTTAPQPVAVINGGEASLAISNIQIAGPDAADFSLIGGTACIGAAISPGPAVQCSFEVAFTPSTLGPEAAVVAVFDDAPGSPQILELAATGQVPSATVSPLSVNFGAQPENSRSSVQSITLTNSGVQNLTVNGVVESGADISEFDLAPGVNPGSALCGAALILLPGGQCVIRYFFEPNAVRTFNAQLVFTDSSGQMSSAQQIVALTGIGTATAPTVNLSANSLDLGNQTVGSQGAAQSVTLKNSGSAALSITSIALAGTNAGEFAILPPGTNGAAGSTCPLSGGTVVVQATCTVAVVLAPQTPGPKSASLVFTDNAATSAQQVTLTGAAGATPSLQVSPAGLTFAPQSEGIASAPQTITIMNAGAGADEISGIMITGPNATDFSSPASCTPNPVPAGKSCQIGVTFSPGATALGTRSATLNVPSGNPPTVSLTGTATQPGISLPTSVNFGSQLAGGSGSAPQPVVVTNSSSGAFAGSLTVTAVTITGANAGDFVPTTDTCFAASTPPAGTCSIQVAFKPLSACPTITIARSATLTLTDTAPGSPHSVPLSGTAADSCITTVPGQPIIQPISAGTPFTYPLDIDASEGFTGSATLACAVQPANASGPAFVGSCAVTTSPATNPPSVKIAPGNPVEVQVAVTTVASQSAMALQEQFNRLVPPRLLGLGWMELLALTLLAAAAGRSRTGAGKIVQIAALVLASAVAMSACGGGTSAVDPPPPFTQPGSYTVTVIATCTPTGQPSITRTFQFGIAVD
jgi:hypothetical protein